MAEDLDLDLSDSTTEEQEKTNKVEKRIKDLSEKVRVTATERDDLAKAKDQAEADKGAALKDVDFYKNFSTVSSKYTGAAEYQDKIKEKVNAGYDLEDATISILAKEGKFVPPAQPVEVKPRQSPAGGSATTTVKAGGEKPIKEMTSSDLRAALVEAEARGDISLN